MNQSFQQRVTIDLVTQDQRTNLNFTEFTWLDSTENWAGSSTLNLSIQVSKKDLQV